jgi:phosphoglycerate dehydrogenase-like enzyme
MDGRAFSLMKSDAVLINTARGPIVDIGALHQALKDDQLAAAALDVMPSEPPSAEEPLIRDFLHQEAWLRGRLLLTPHGAWNSRESRRDARRLATETVMDYLLHGRLRNLVNADYLDRSRMKQGG